MAKMEKKALSTPDEKRSFDKGKVELATLGGVRMSLVQVMYPYYVQDMMRGW